MNLDKTVDPAQFAEVMAEARPGMVRMGGDRWRRYNWENNDSNAGSDYEYQNDDYLSASTSLVPPSSLRSRLLRKRGSPSC